MASNSRTISRATADFIYDSFYAGAIGGSVVALFFLLVDSMMGQPLYTPSLMGSVLFAGAAADSVVGVRLDMVAYYTLVHFVLFGAAGTLVAFLVHQVELHARHPAEVLLLLFLILEGGFLVGSYLAMPGVVSQLGMARVFTANLLAAVGMGIFLIRAHRPDVWQRVKRVVFPSQGA